MQKTFITICLITLLGIGTKGAYAQAMHLNLKDGTSVEYALERISKITFETGEMNIVRTNHTTDMFPLADLQWVNFTEEVTGIEEPQSFANGMLTAYPNPVSHTLTVNLSNLQEANGTISIISIDGRLVKTVPSGQNEIINIDMSTLPKGLYLLRYQSVNGKIEAIKIVKQ